MQRFRARLRGRVARPPHQTTSRLVLRGPSCALSMLADSEPRVMVFTTPDHRNEPWRRSVRSSRGRYSSSARSAAAGAARRRKERTTARTRSPSSARARRRWSRSRPLAHLGVRPRRRPRAPHPVPTRHCAPVDPGDAHARRTLGPHTVPREIGPAPRSRDRVVFLDARPHRVTHRGPDVAHSDTRPRVGGS
jgi:hypothetical protein